MDTSKRLTLDSRKCITLTNMLKKLGILSLVAACAFLGACAKTTNAIGTTTEKETTTKETMTNTNPDKTIFDLNDVFSDPEIVTPLHNDYFGSVTIEDVNTIKLASDGDLWAQCWADDGYIYAANGDGAGFGNQWHDITLSKINGTPYDGNMIGYNINAKNMSKVWYPSTNKGTHNRKPTGMICVDGVLYMAVQDLNNTDGGNIFNEAPAATIIKSTDHGLTWTYDNEKPMFDEHIFTTIFFLDYGKNSENNEDGYVYAYGLDYNWRDSFSGCVKDPTSLYLARIPKDYIMDKSKWEFYTGDLEGNASWSAPGDIDSKTPVLTDQRRVYENLVSGSGPRYSVLGQGSVVYNKALGLYFYSSWTEYTFELYYSETPWGEWIHFFSKDFGRYKWNLEQYGGYATVIPSKYISDDGLTMYVVNATFAGGVRDYAYSMRKITLSLVDNEAKATNKKNNHNLANFSYGENPKVAFRMSDPGVLSNFNDGDSTVGNTSYNGCTKYDYPDFWAVTLDKPFNMNELVYTVGEVDSVQGGWFTKMKVQYRMNGEWIDVTGLQVSENYTFDKTLESYSKITMRFNEVVGTGIRVIGIAGGGSSYTTMAELEVYYR